MIGLLHGYLLEGSGSNLWTRAIVRALAQSGEEVHLVCQEMRPQDYDFISAAYRHTADGQIHSLFNRASPYPGAVICHQPDIGRLLPVYVRDHYPHFQRVVPMLELTDAEIADYLERNVRVLARIVEKWGLTALHANHAVLMSVVAERVAREKGIAFAIMPHGSALEYAVKADKRMLALADSAFKQATNVFVIGDEIRTRLQSIFPDMADLAAKTILLPLGVDVAEFRLGCSSDRSATIKTFLETLQGLPRGRSVEQTAQVIAAAQEPFDLKQLTQQFATVSKGYAGKCTDHNLEAKIQSIDWQQDQVLLYVGRLIAAKGLMSVLIALPHLCAKQPNLKLVIVGHGPLREFAEAFVVALASGERARIWSLVAMGSVLENPIGYFPVVQQYLEELEVSGELPAWLAAGRNHVRVENVVFTGYLTHRELVHLFSCCAAAVFPSIVPEAGPLVFLEALASGCFPLGTYFAGMAASIDSAASAIPPEVSNLMKLRISGTNTIKDIIANVPEALTVAFEHRQALRQWIEKNHDWIQVAANLSKTLQMQT